MLSPLQGCRILVTGYLGLRSQARFSPGYNIAGLQPSEPAYDLSHVSKVFDKAFQARGAGRKEVTDGGPFEWIYSSVRFRRKLRPMEQWCVSSPRRSMAPLNGGENIGEDAPGRFGKGRLSRLEECISRGSKADWNRTSIASKHVVLSLYESQTRFCLPSFLLQGARSDSTCREHARGPFACCGRRCGRDGALGLCSRGFGAQWSTQCALL